MEINCQQGWVGKSMAQLDLSPDPKRIFKKEDVVIAVGANEDMDDIK